MSPRSRRARRSAILGVVAIGILASSCAYYNTMYMARKYYFRATTGAPYSVDRDDTPDIGSLNKAIEYSKKLIASYPKSKWVDDAYLLWARAFLAKNDPLQCVSMLEDFNTRYPRSPMATQALFYKGVALRQARRYTEAIAALNDFLAKKPPGELIPYAQLERARALMALDRPGDAAAAATVVVDRWPKSALAVTARLARAQAYFNQGAFDKARADYAYLGGRSRSDDERLDYLLRESECLESGRRFDEGLTLLRGALSHEHPPLLPDTTGGKPLVVQQTPGYDRYGRLLIRIGSLELMGGRVNDALNSYQHVVDAYPRTPVAAEAQYRIGYALEVGADDFEKARTEYAKVREISSGSPFVDQAQQRQNTLDQLSRFRSAGGDSSDQRAEAGFLLAEQYLFQLDKPERALDEYRKVEADFKGTPWAGKALNAQAWVLKHKFDRPAAAESLLWRVVNEYPATEAQLAARDYLEGMGQQVVAALIQLPPPPRYTRADSLRADSMFVADSTRYALARPLTPPPAATTPLGLHPGAAGDSLGRFAGARPGLTMPVGADSLALAGPPGGPGGAPASAPGMFGGSPAGPVRVAPGSPILPGPPVAASPPGASPPSTSPSGAVVPAPPTALRGAAPDSAARAGAPTPAATSPGAVSPPPAIAGATPAVIDTSRARQVSAPGDTSRAARSARFKPRGERIQ